MANLKDVIYLSNEDYETLVSTGTVVIGGDTLTYNENNVYVTPEKIATTTEDGLMSASDKGNLDQHLVNTSNPHQVTKAQVGLGNVDNTSDLNKPISTATQAALDELEAELEEAPVEIVDGSAFKVSGIDDGLALAPASQMEMKEIRGNTVVWNQLYKIKTNQNPSIAAFDETTGEFTINGTVSTAFYILPEKVATTSGHQYLVGGLIGSSNTDGHIYVYNSSNVFAANNFDSTFVLVSAANTVAEAETITIKVNTGTYSNVKFRPIFYDMGATTYTRQSAFVQWAMDYAVKHPAYNAGSLVDVNMAAFETTGINQWNEEWERGFLNPNTGADAPNARRIRSKNFIRVIGGKSYILGATNGSTNIFVILYYDHNKNLVDNLSAHEVTNGVAFTLPEYVSYIKFYTANTWYGGTYNHDIYVNVSDASVDARYQPYIKHTYPLVWMGKSAGAAYDTEDSDGAITRRVGSVDLSTLSFSLNSDGVYVSDASKTDMRSNGGSDPYGVAASWILSAKYPVYSYNNLKKSSTTKGIALINQYIYVKDSAAPSGDFHYELLTQTTEQGEPLPTAIAVYQGGLEWQICDGAPAVIVKDYDISIRDQVITNVRVDARQEEEITALKVAATNLVETTWAELKSLKDSGNLVPGQQYRITDYQCTTTQTDTSSAGHQFDIIVVADSNNILNEKARACLHTGDTYFANSKLEVWQILYCLDNDTDRFTWADTTNGKGVIYRMIDEFKNDIPYDFKNILFTGESNDETITFVNAYTFSYTEDNVIKDGSLLGLDKECYSNVMKADVNFNGQQRLNFNVFYSTTDTFQCHSNTLGFGCSYNTFGRNCLRNAFGNDCSSNTFKDYCKSNTFGNSCSENSFGVSCSSNIFMIDCSSNKFGDVCTLNTFGNECTYNTFGNGCQYNIFGTGCSRNKFGDTCTFNAFGNGCSYVTFGSSSSPINFCSYNTLDVYCRNLYIKGSETTLYSNQLQNIHIHSGVRGSSASMRKTITVDVGLAYETNVYVDANGNIEMVANSGIISAINANY